MVYLKQIIPGMTLKGLKKKKKNDSDENSGRR